MPSPESDKITPEQAIALLGETYLDTIAQHVTRGNLALELLMSPPDVPNPVDAQFLGSGIRNALDRTLQDSIALNRATRLYLATGELPVIIKADKRFIDLAEVNRRFRDLEIGNPPSRI